MSVVGESLFLYDNGEDVFPEVHLNALQDGKSFELLNGIIAGVAGLMPITLSDGKQLLGFAYHRGYDVADTRFELFAFKDQTYQSVFEQVTTQGRMRILSISPLRFELWSANNSFDKTENSCVWCPHRYSVKTYEQKADNFDVIAQRTTKQFLDPSVIAAKPFSPIENGQR